MNKNSSKVVYLIPNKLLPILTPYLNSILELHQNGFEVEVISLLPQKELFTLGEEFVSKASYHSINNEKLDNYLMKLETKISKVKYYQGFINQFFFCLKVILSFRISKKSIIIATDSFSVFLAFLFNKCRSVKYFYYPQEMNHSTDAIKFVLKFQKKLERMGQSKAQAIVEFDEIRANLRVKDDNIINKQFIIIPNSQRGKPETVRNYYFNDLLNIPTDKIIVLYTGGIATYNWTNSIAESTKFWREDFVLVMHLWGSELELYKILKDFSQFNNIFFSTTKVDYTKINLVYSSCDIGLVLYGGEDINHKNSGFSSGKLFNYLKNSKPIIFNNTSLYKEHLQDTNCGISINSPLEISKALSTIGNKLEFYQRSCYQNFSRFEYSTWHKKLIEGINKVVLDENSI